MTGTLQVEVIYAERGRAWRQRVACAEGTSVSVLMAGMDAWASDWPEAARAPAAFAVFGREVAADSLLRDGDRLELLRALPNDPKLARRERAQTKTPR